MKNIALVCNPTSPKAISTTNKIIQLLSERKVEHQVFCETWPISLANYTDIWIIGGDGTLHRFINQYYHLNTPICLFNAGTGNDLHFTLYNNSTLAEQVKRALGDTPPIFIDIGECNQRLFSVGVGIGFDGAVVHDLLGKKMLAGSASYFPSILKILMDFKETNLTFHFNDKSFTQDCFLVSVANIKRYGGGYFVAPKALVTDNLLDVSIVSNVPKQERIAFLGMLAKGEHLGLPIVQYNQTNKITITAPVPLHAHIDGEYMKASHFDIKLASKKIAFSGVLPL